MKVALCLYGQPRHLTQGYSFLSEQILSVYQPDVFIHSWDSKVPYSVSPWRPINPTPLADPEDIVHLYRPKKIEIEPAKVFSPDSYPRLVEATTNPAQRKNIPNILSQLHSRQRVRDLFLQALHEGNSYDLVIATRFDIQIHSLPVFNGGILFTDTHPERPHIFNDNLVMLTPEDFTVLFNFEPLLLKLEQEGKVPLNMEDVLTQSLTVSQLLTKARKTGEIQIKHL